MKRSINIGEELNFRDEYLSLAEDLCHRILNTEIPVKKTVIAIGGESGCGKSTTTYCLQKTFIDKGINCTSLHMDSYFKLPPKDNHKNRLKNLNNVGPQEVNMSLINKHINSFKNGLDEIQIPIVNYKGNYFTNIDQDLSNIEVLIVEGVYTFLLNNIDHKIFLSRTYHDTYQNRLKRTREKHEPIIESILEIEHQIVSSMIEQADFIVEKNYQVKE